ncbi:LysR family glycine cleavage system transcriptional activator [Pseudoduganella lurida]|uniref:LysR family glycine cleavage system transcriptional activator n=1 Tax=Pseudoduganella lurida TaxID=1036180 RepID=A0A562RIS7_9BURK|nr:LysR substrate-binding domain-containing protein [Pseudoduganella lurida]TWI68987.1 LysR family glycine cleavage system transcriptional activator [Pseudoduganella lurida]
MQPNASQPLPFQSASQPGAARTLRSLSGLIDFDCAARWGSFTLAAQELHKTPAAISLQVKQLEEVVGFTLFVRHPRHIALTPKGQELAITVARMLKELRGKVDALRGGDEEHVLRISTTHTFAIKFLAPRLGRFTKLHPELDIRLDSCERLVDVENEDVDLAIRHGIITDHPAALYHDRLVVVYSPELLAPGQQELGLADLTRYPLLYDETTEFWVRLLRTEGMPEGPFDFSRGFTNLAVAAQAAIVGQGIALVPYWLAWDDIGRGVLRMMRGASASVEYPHGYYFVHASRKASLPKVLAFTNWIQDEVGQMARSLHASLASPAVPRLQA